MNPAIDYDRIRGDVAVAAARNERRNRPTHLIIIAIALAAAATLALLFMVQRRNDARRMFEKEQRIGGDAVELVQQLLEIKAAEESTNVRYGGPESDLTPSKFFNAASAAGLKNPPRLPTRNPTVDRDMGGVHRTRWFYDVKDESLPNLMRWVQQAVRDIPGLEVYSISLKPEATQWSLRVTFSRWERTEAKK